MANRYLEALNAPEEDVVEEQPTQEAPQLLSTPTSEPQSIAEESPSIINSEGSTGSFDSEIKLLQHKYDQGKRTRELFEDYDNGDVGDSVDSAKVGNLNADIYRGVPEAMKLELARKEEAIVGIKEEDEGIGFTDVVNFLAGPEMGILGMKYDQEGFEWKWQNAVDMWSEHPIMSSIAALSLGATVIFPASGALLRSAKVGSIAAKGKIGGILPAPKSLKGKSLLMDDFGELTPSNQWHAQLAHMIDEVDHYTGGGNAVPKYFDSEVGEKLGKLLASGQGDEALKIVGGRKGLRKLLLGEAHRTKFAELAAKMSNPRLAEASSRTEKLRWMLQVKFGNTYFNQATRIKGEYVDQLHDFYKNARFDKLFDEAIPEEHWDSWYRYMYDDLDPKTFAALSPELQNSFKNIGDLYLKLQKTQLDEGLITPDTFAHVGRRHLFAANKNTPGEIISDMGLYIRGEPMPTRLPQLSSVTLAPRYKTREQVLQAMEEGKLITNPEVLHNTSYIRDSLLLNSYRFMRDIVVDGGIKGSRTELKGFFTTMDNYATMPSNVKSEWIPLDKIPGVNGVIPETLRRMVNTRLVKEGAEEVGQLPVISRQLFEEMLGKDGLFQNIENAHTLFEVLTAIHKTARTALNPATHVQNLAGNLFGFLPMAGYNVMTPQHLSDGKGLTRVFTAIAKKKELTEEGMSLTQLFSKEQLAKFIDDVAPEYRKITTNAGTTFDLADELHDPMVRQLIEDSSFDKVEGFSALNEMFSNMQRAGEKSGTLARNIANAVLKIEGRGGKGRLAKARFKTLNTMGSAYLGEDMVPKLMYYVDLRRKGWSRNSAVMEVGRRLPQYKTAGSAIQAGRRWMFPWLTFPSETARIMKNNLMDNPIGMLPFLYTPSIAQSMVSATGLGPNINEIDTLKEAAPAWASKGTTVMLEGGGKAGAVLGGLSGATIAGVFGNIAAGPWGALAGAAGGGAAGAALGYKLTEEEPSVRAWVMDFLPHSSLMPSTTAQHAIEGRNPVTALYDMSPVEPFAVMMPLVRVMMGEGSFGQEIPVEGLNDAVSKTLMGLYGFLSPPLMQKYGMYVGEPQTGMFYMDELGSRLGGAAVGATLGLGMGPGAVAGLAAAGGLIKPNTARLMYETGAATNPKTGETGNAFYDVWLKSLTGMSKSWKVGDTQQMFNEKLLRDRFKDLRGLYQSRLDNAIINGRTEEADYYLGKIFRTFSQEYDNGQIAQTKFTDYVTRRADKMVRHPMLKGWSKERLISRMMEASNFAGDGRGAMSSGTADAIRAELISRMRVEGKGYDVDMDLGSGKIITNENDRRRKRPRRKRKEDRI